jgi:hypothetical protein
MILTYGAGNTIKAVVIEEIEPSSLEYLSHKQSMVNRIFAACLKQLVLP